MTEDDTFERLKRVDPDWLITQCWKKAKLGQDIFAVNHSVIERCGWTLDAISEYFMKLDWPHRQRITYSTEICDGD